MDLGIYPGGRRSKNLLCRPTPVFVFRVIMLYIWQLNPNKNTLIYETNIRFRGRKRLFIVGKFIRYKIWKICRSGHAPPLKFSTINHNFKNLYSSDGCFCSLYILEYLGKYPRGMLKGLRFLS